MARDYYEVLGMPRNAAKEQIKDAYRKLAMEWHPDRNKSKEAEERFKEISEAYAVLSDDEKKAQYDAYGSAGFSRMYTREDIFRDADFEEVFSKMGFGSVFGRGFGDIFSNMFFSGRRRGGEDLQYELELTLEEVAKGAEKEISINRLKACDNCHGTGSADGKKAICKNCNGTGQVRSSRRAGYSEFVTITPCRICGGEGKTLTSPCKSCHGQGNKKGTEHFEVKVPKGAYNGFALKLKGKGNMVEGEEGNLYLIIRIAEHEYFKRDGGDIHFIMTIPFTTAALGGEVEVPTLHGKIKLKIPPGTEAGKSFRLHGKGTYDLRFGETGDQIVRVNIDIPKKLSKKQRSLLEEFQKESHEHKGFFGRFF